MGIIGEAAWACSPGAELRTGDVVLEGAGRRFKLAQAVPRFGDAVFGGVELEASHGAARTFTLRLEAYGRCRFGEVLRFTVK